MFSRREFLMASVAAAAVAGPGMTGQWSRAMAQQEDPTGDSLRKLVDSIVGEKLEDGQLDESDLTYGDLTKVKVAIVDALIGYYHTRIPYPGFPGPRAEDQ